MSLPLLRLKNRITGLFDKESKTLFRNSAWVFVANATGALYSFLRSVIIARGLGAETLGHYTVAIAFVLTIQEILKLNTGVGIIRFGAEYRTAGRPDKMIALIKRSVLYSLSSAALSVLAIGVMLMFFYDSFLEVKGLSWFILLYSAVNGISFLDNISKSVLNLYYRFRINSAIQILMDTIEFALVAACIYFYRDDLTRFFATVIIARLTNTIICNAAAALEMKKELGAYLHSGMQLIDDQRREIWRYIAGNSFSNTLKTFMNQGDVLLLSALCGPAAVGLYAVAKKLAYSVLTITDPLVKSIFPQLSLLVYENKFDALKVMLRKITLAAMIPAAIFMVVAIFLKDWILATIYGKQFLPAANAFVIHLAGALQGSVFFWSLPLVNSLGMATMRLRIYLLAILAGLPVAWLGASLAGAAGVAAGLLTANLLITALFLWFAYRYIRQQEAGASLKVSVR